MPDGSRSLPGRPNLRYLRLEAKRRHALAIRIRDNRTRLVLTSRLIPVNSIDTALPGAGTNPQE